MIPLEDPTSLSLLFHLNSEPWLNDDAYRTASHDPAEDDAVKALAEVALPRPAETTLDAAIARRRSCRAYAPEPMSLAELASVLRAAYGSVAHFAEGGPDRSRRAVPSAGGLYPLEVYAYLRRVDDLDDGLYHYDAPTHTLELLEPGDLFETLAPMFYAYPFIVEADVVLVLAATFLRTQAKYGPRGYRYILLEAGHVGQNVCLQACELGLASLCMGGFVDSLLNDALGLDPRRGGAVYAIGVGHGLDDPDEAGGPGGPDGGGGPASEAGDGPVRDG